jgi:NADPH:quinone reductase-like Zn-dependent oxidoreductase
MFVTVITRRTSLQCTRTSKPQAVWAVKKKWRGSRRWGVTDVVNYRATPDWERAVMDLTGGQGADHVLELGGAGTFRKSLLALRVGGRLYAIGNLAGEAQINPQMILAKRANVHGLWSAAARCSKR